MARPLRLQFPGGRYHVTAWGNGRQPLFADDTDRERFLTVLARVVARYHLFCHAHCLMGNHYHLLLETPHANLSHAMRQLIGVYSQAFNRRHEGPGACVGKPLADRQRHDCPRGPAGAALRLASSLGRALCGRHVTR